jgi:molecular chaperone DnaJ
VDVKESYRILQLKPGAELEEIKASYRRLAFKLHPDLNPNDPKAAENFQRLNEAYVILQEAVGDEVRYEGARQRRAEAGKKRRQADELRKKAEEKLRKEEQRRKAEQKARAEQARRKEAGPFSGASHHGGSAAGPDARGRSSGTAGASQPGGAAAGRSRSRPKRDVIRNIMNDPFARKVFDEIYSHIRNGGGKKPGAVKKRQVTLNWGEKQLKLDLSRGVFAATKDWFKRQFDDEQTVYLTPGQLMPGSRLKLSIRRAWTGKPASVEVSLPSDYVVGRPIRLKGLGRQFGPFKGDLYLRLMAK